MKAWPFIFGGSGLAVIGGALVAWRKEAATKAATTAAVESGGALTIRVTGYWPFTARADEQKMEGGVFDRKMPAKFKNDPSSAEYKAHVLHTVEDFFAGRSDFVSLSGDDAAWPYGQKLLIPWTEGRTITGRVVDTGRNFRGSNKVYRIMGAEPIDVCVESSKTVVPKPPVVIATIIKGDTLDRPGKEVVAERFQGQHVVVGDLEMLGAERRVWGSGIKDGRGYGPYDTGYFDDEDGCECPFGPNGERLTPDHDFRCGAGGYITGGLRAPRKILPGYRWSNYAGRGEYGKDWGMIRTASARAA